MPALIGSENEGKRFLFCSEEGWFTLWLSIHQKGEQNSLLAGREELEGRVLSLMGHE